jgi:hypothetical protein
MSRRADSFDDLVTRDPDITSILRTAICGMMADYTIIGGQTVLPGSKSLTGSVSRTSGIGILLLFQYN